MTLEHGRRAVFLQEMGVGAVWVRRADRHALTAAAEIAAPESLAARPVAAVPEAPEAALASAAAAWDESPPATTNIPIVPLQIDPATLPTAAEIAVMDWPQLQAAVNACRGCELCQNRSQTVFGSGDRQAKWLFVGVGPGRNEDRQGAPFAGPAGELLDRMLSAMNLKRDVDVYLANLVKCRSGAGQDADSADPAPSPLQIALCKPYLERQIALLQPTVIVALGHTAALALLGCAPGASLSSLRGQLHRVDQRPLVVTYDPAYLLRNPVAKREAWDDLCLALRSYADQSDRTSE